MDFVKELLYYCNVYTKKPHEILPERIAYSDLTLVLSGSLTYVIDENEYVLRENDVMLLPPNTMRQRRAGEGAAKYVSFNFISNSDTLDGFDVYMPSAVSNDMRGILSVFSQEHLSLLYHSKEKATCVLNYILYELLDNKSLESNNYHITKALRYIHENIKLPLTLDGISE